jgi:hypothetical protein
MPLRYDDRAWTAIEIARQLAKTPPGSSAWGNIQGTITAQTDLIQYISDHAGSPAWGNITGMLTAQTDLSQTLNGKANNSHTHPETDVTNLVTDLAGKANVSHTHGEGDVTNLVTDLAGKAAVSHTHTQAQSHNSPDTDVATTSLHHTIGTSATQAAAGNHTHAASVIGYAINVQALTSSPVDAQTIYFGMLPKVPVTTGGQSKIYIRAAGTIKRAEIYCYSGTAGTAEAWSMYVRKNNTTDTLIQTLSVSAAERVFTNSSLSIAMVTGDYFEIKAVNPTWATNPLTTIIGGYVYIE